jgi:protein SCO1/2
VESRALIQIKAFLGFFWTDSASDFNCHMGKILRGRIPLMLSVMVALYGCNRAPAAADATARHYEARGIIRGFAPDRSTVDVEHEDIRGFMPSMTMPLAVHNPKEIVDLKTGDAISFRLNVADQDVWIDNIKKIAPGEVHLPTPAPTPAISPKVSERLKEGDTMPSFGLTNQDGEHITLDTFRGEPFVLTFVFTRCPLPNFCPRTSHNFADLQSAIKTGGGALAETRLLSITLDPAFDKPPVLKEYGAYQNSDSKVWTFATGEPAAVDALTHAFSVYVQTEGGTISHGLATALIDKNGKIDKIWRGNMWRPEEVIEEIKQHGD